jgi:transglutaminase-like putative cysteine protease
MLCLALPGPLSERDLRKPAIYTFLMKPDFSQQAERWSAIPKTGEQTAMERGDGAILLTVRLPDHSESGEFPYVGASPEILQALSPNQYVESEAPEIRRLSAAAVGTAQTLAEAARNIECFVNTHIIHKNPSVEYASAAEVAESREGDCTEHAVLAVALCRAAGIPAQIVVGLVCLEGDWQLSPHMWYRVFNGKRWISFDAAAGGFGTGHIAFAYGDGCSKEGVIALQNAGMFHVIRVETSGPSLLERIPTDPFSVICMATVAILLVRRLRRKRRERLEIG